MNAALSSGRELELRDLFVLSDAHRDPQAHVLRPDVVLDLAAQIVEAPTPYLRVRRAAVATLESLRDARDGGVLELGRAETRWLDRLSVAAGELPEDEDEFVEQMLARIDRTKLRLGEYELEA